MTLQMWSTDARRQLSISKYEGLFIVLVTNKGPRLSHEGKVQVRDFGKFHEVKVSHTFIGLRVKDCAICQCVSVGIEELTRFQKFI